jgi:hypothetical protein
MLAKQDRLMAVHDESKDRWFNSLFGNAAIPAHAMSG